MLCRNPIKNGSAAVVRRAVLTDIGFAGARGETCYFDEGFDCLEDIECWLRVALLGRWLIEGLPEVLGLYRLNRGGLSAGERNGLRAWERPLRKARGQAPGLMARWEGKATACYLRYRAQRAVLLGHRGDGARRLIHGALRRHPRLLAEEPLGTLLVLLGAHAQELLPEAPYHALRGLALHLAGAMQRRGVLHD